MGSGKKVNKIFLSTTLVSSLIMSGTIMSVSASSVKTDSSAVMTTIAAATATKKIVYNDNDAKAGWSKDMQWAIDKGIITAYVNTKHPTTKKVGNWLDPNGKLTEGQMTTIFMKYAKPAEMKSTKATNTKFPYSVAYQLAKKYNIPVIASTSRTGPANGVTTRGMMAQAIASLHYKQKISEKDAVNFLYKAGLTSGYAVKGKYPKSYASFKPQETLTRAQAVSFIKRYDEYVAKNGSAKPPTSTQPSNPAPSKPSTPTKQVVSGITVDYGKHTYASANQTQYNEVMKIIKDKAKGLDSVTFGGENNKYFEEYLNGARPSNTGGGRVDRDSINAREIGLMAADEGFKEMISNGVSKDVIRKYDKISRLASELYANISDPRDGSPRSAYDALVRRINDCDSQAQIQSAMFDYFGFNTAIIAGDNHADLFLEIGGKWYHASSGSALNLKEYMSNKGYYVMSQPTNGDIINSNGTITKAK